MRIISRFHDYYDGAMAHGQDMTVVYMRKFEMLKLDECKLPFSMPRYALLNDLSNKNVDLYFVPVTILFCGKLYRAIQVLDRKHPKYYSNHDYHGDTFFELDDLQKFLEDSGFDTSDAVRRSYKASKRKYPFFRQEMRDYFADNKTIQHSQFCIDNRITALAVTKRFYNGYYMTSGDYKVLVNPRLIEHCFFKLFDAFSAYQEIDMWISGVLPRTTTPLVEIADEHKISEHGFDEWSFRKLPTKKK